MRRRPEPTLVLGILGQYVGRMYDDVKGRPLFLIREDTKNGPG